MFTYKNTITWWAFKIFSVDDWWSCTSRVIVVVCFFMLQWICCYFYYFVIVTETYPSFLPMTDWRFLHLRKICVENSLECFTTPHAHTNTFIPILFCSKSRTFWHHVENQLNTNNNKSVKTWMEFFKTAQCTRKGSWGILCTLRIFLFIDLRLHNFQGYQFKNFQCVYNEKPRLSTFKADCRIFLLLWTSEIEIYIKAFSRRTHK